MGGVRFKIRAGGPFVRARVVNRLSQRGEGFDVGAGSAQEHERDGTLSRRLPLDGVGLVRSDLVVQAGFGDGVTGRALVIVGLGVGSGQGSHGRDKEGGERTHFGCFVLI